MSLKKKWFIALTLAIILSVSSMLCLDSFAIFYDSEYPVDVGIESGLWIRFIDYNGDECVLVVNQSVYDNVIFMSDGSLLNSSSSTINTIIFINGNQYPARFSSRSVLQVNRNPNTQLAYWDDIYIDEIQDMNFNFKNINPDNPYVNNNLDFSRFEIALLGILVTILFFEVMGWYLLHKR